MRAALSALNHRFDEDQPRVPAGSPGGGQFAKGSGGGDGGSSAKPDTKLPTGPGGNEATAGSHVLHDE